LEPKEKKEKILSRIKERWSGKIALKGEKIEVSGINCTNELRNHFVEALNVFRYARTLADSRLKLFNIYVYSTGLNYTHHQEPQRLEGLKLSIGIHKLNSSLKLFLSQLKVFKSFTLNSSIHFILSLNNFKPSLPSSSKPRTIKSDFGLRK
jgi:hypothetical protein